MLDEGDNQLQSKWGPCGAVPVTTTGRDSGAPDGWRFFGNAP
ncbi:MULTISPECIES: hypothetical protein [Actinomycetes]|nr:MULTISPECIES: hypothetical protein [Actinomycetes]